MKAIAALIALVFLLTACTPAEISLPTQDSITVFPTKTDILTLSPTFTATAQVIPSRISTPSMWQIWFRGYSCEGWELCGEGGEGRNPKSSYFSINSDGTALEPVEISSIPTPQLPDSAPPLPDGYATVPQVSPDKSMLTYGARENGIFGLYLVDIQTGRATKLYQTETIEDHLFWIGTACWSPDGQTIDFMLHSRAGMDNQPPVMYRIDRDGSHLQALYSFPGLENAWFGTCSPDGKELVLSIPGNTNSMENGLYVIDRISGHSRQILSNFFASVVRTPQEGTP